MSTFARVNTAAEAVPDPTKHVNYVLGMVLGQDDFKQEFAYHDGRDQWLARDLLGYGTVTGLPVTIGLDKGRPRVEVGPGVALSPLGQLIRVCSAQCAVLNDWLTLNKTELQKRLTVTSPPSSGLKLYVVLCYRECLVENVPIPGEPCRTEAEVNQPSRIKDDFKLDLRFQPPDQQEEDALRDFVQWLSAVDISDSASSTPLEDFLTEVRKAAHGIGSLPDFMFGSPPAFLHIATRDACQYLRAAFRVWTVELRQLWRPKGLGKVGCCADHTADDDPPVEECLLLAELDIALGADLHVTVPTDVHVNEDRRPYLLHLRFLQEWLTCGNRSGTSPFGSLSGDVIGSPGANTLQAIQGDPVLKPVGGLKDNFVLTFKNHTWQGAVLPAAPPPPPVTLAGDVQGPAGTNAVKKLQGKDVNAATPQPKQVLTFDNGVWQPKDLPAAPPPPPVTLAGDVTGLAPSNRVEKIQNLAVNMAGAGSGDVLTFRGTSWTVESVPATPPPANVVEHPPGLPAYLIVAAGFVRGDGTAEAPGIYNQLTATAAPGDGGILNVTFKGYQNPAQPQAGVPPHQYIVKVLPIQNDGPSTMLIVNFTRFEANTFALLVTRLNGAPPTTAELRGRRFMIEVSEYRVPG